MNLQDDRKTTIEWAMNRPYKAMAFDVDGTLTPFARFTIPDELILTLQRVPLNVPLAICTGRPLDYILGKLNQICGTYPDQRKRWAIICENGGSGYTYNAETDSYDQFFEVKWPSAVIEQEVLAANIKDRLGWHVRVLIREHSLVVVYLKWMYLFPRFVRLESVRVAKKLRKMLKDMGLQDEFTVQDSGLGSLFVPKDSGKGRAMRRWAKHMGINVKDIAVVGDRPEKGGNDEDFLCGKYGTAFTVGKLTGRTYPLPVFSGRKRLTGPEGTLQLVESIKFDKMK